MRLMDKLIAYKIRAGDISAFENLVDKHKLRVFNYCLRTVGNYHQAEDLMQDIFLKVYENIQSYNSSKASLTTWIFAIAHNTCLNSFRKSTVDIALDDAYLHTSNPSIEDVIIIKDNLSKLSEIISHLSPEDKSLVILKDYLGHKNREISVILDIPVGTIKSRLHSIRLKIRTEMGDNYD